MLSKQHKLRGKRAIDVLAKTGKRKASVFFIVKYKPNNQKTSRWVIVVSAKVHKSAVKRNRIKRQVREIVRQDIVPTLPSLDVLLVVKDAALGKEYSVLQDDLVGLFESIQQ